MLREHGERRESRRGPATGKGDRYVRDVWRDERMLSRRIGNTRCEAGSERGRMLRGHGGHGWRMLRRHAQHNQLAASLSPGAIPGNERMAALSLTLL